MNNQLGAKALNAALQEELKGEGSAEGTNPAKDSPWETVLRGGPADGASIPYWVEGPGDVMTAGYNGYRNGQKIFDIIDTPPWVDEFFEEISNLIRNSFLKQLEKIQSLFKLSSTM